jgi:CRISPR-associated protein Csb2
MLTLEVEFLLGRCYATDPTRRDEAEWPPHPARLFSALVNAVFDSPPTGEGDEAEIKCLHWLEERDPPSIEASTATRRDVKIHYVPVNDMELPSRLPPSVINNPEKASEYLNILPDVRTRKERFFPSVTPETPVVRYGWSDATPDAEMLATLSTLASRVAYLGHSSSVVRVSVSDIACQPSLVPMPRGKHVLRVPGKGQLDALRQSWNIHRGVRTRTLPSRHVAYASPQASPPEVRSGYFGDDWLILRTVHGSANRPLPIKAVSVLTRSLRDAVLAALGNSSSPVISGHEADGSPTQSPHIGFVALPDVGHLHAHAGVLGLAIVPSSNLSPIDEARLKTAVRSLTRLYWKDGEVIVEPLSERHDRATLRPLTWCRPSKAWATVTPFVFDRFPKTGRWSPEAEGLVQQACVYAGLPKPSRVALVGVSPVLGVPPVNDFPLWMRKSGSSARLQSHVVMEFDEPVAGPVMIGAGRFFGYGLCRPVRDPFASEDDEG